MSNSTNTNTDMSIAQALTEQASAANASRDAQRAIKINTLVEQLASRISSDMWGSLDDIGRPTGDKPHKDSLIHQALNRGHGWCKSAYVSGPRNDPNVTGFFYNMPGRPEHAASAYFNGFNEDDGEPLPTDKGSHAVPIIQLIKGPKQDHKHPKKPFGEAAFNKIGANTLIQQLNENFEHTGIKIVPDGFIKDFGYTLTFIWNHKDYAAMKEKQAADRATAKKQITLKQHQNKLDDTHKHKQDTLMKQRALEAEAARAERNKKWEQQ
jgi:hypothetical protein